MLQREVDIRILNCPRWANLGIWSPRANPLVALFLIHARETVSLTRFACFPCCYQSMSHRVCTHDCSSFISRSRFTVHWGWEM